MLPKSTTETLSKIIKDKTTQRWALATGLAIGMTVGIARLEERIVAQQGEEEIVHRQCAVQNPPKYCSTMYALELPMFLGAMASIPLSYGLAQSIHNAYDNSKKET